MPQRATNGWREIGEEFETAWYLSKTTTTLDADVTWTVDGKTVEADSRLIHMDFDGNGTVNRTTPKLCWITLPVTGRKFCSGLR